MEEVKVIEDAIEESEKKDSEKFHEKSEYKPDPE